MKSKDANEFYDLASRLAESKRETSKYWWRIFFELIVRELYTSGMVYLPMIGYFRLEHQEAGFIKEVDAKGIAHWYEVPERDKPLFISEDDFINDINMRGVTKSYRKRVKNNTRTLRDRERFKRLQEISGEYEEIPEREVARQLQNYDEFDKLIKQKRQEYEIKLEEVTKDLDDESLQ